MNILNNIKTNRDLLEKEIALVKEAPKYKMHPEQGELINCAEMILYMNQDEFLVAHNEKELGNINALLKEATSLLVHTRELP